MKDKKVYRGASLLNSKKGFVKVSLYCCAAALSPDPSPVYRGWNTGSHLLREDTNYIEPYISDISTWEFVTIPSLQFLKPYEKTQIFPFPPRTFLLSEAIGIFLAIL